MELVINLIGLQKQSLENLLKVYEKDWYGLDVKIKEKHYETYVSFNADYLLKSNIKQLFNVIKTNYKSVLYGVNEYNVYTACFKKLKEENKRISIAESVSAGRLASEFVSNNEGASKILLEGIVCYSVESKIKRLGISSKFFETNSPQSVETSYELASGLFNNSSPDYVIATTGYATNNQIDVNNGKCYIAVGTRRIIHVYKHRFTGSRNHIMQQVSKYAFLHLIKEMDKEDINIEKYL